MKLTRIIVLSLLFLIFSVNSVSADFLPMWKPIKTFMGLTWGTKLVEDKENGIKLSITLGNRKVYTEKSSNKAITFTYGTYNDKLCTGSVVFDRQFYGGAH